MNSTQQTKSHSPGSWRRSPGHSWRRKTLLAILLLFLIRPSVQSQSVNPILSGGVGLLGSRNDGSTFWQPVIAPVLTVPLGDRWLIESRADLRGFVSRTNGTTGPYEAQFFPTLEYAQVDFNATSWLTITAGRFLPPFNIYSERLSAIWISNFQEAPLIVPIGTRTTGYDDGGMVRGALISRPSYQVNYTAYFSALNTINKLTSGRAAGGRAGIFFPRARFEAGFSYQRLLQVPRMNSFGTYFSWQPNRVPIDIKSEYAHSPGGQGYWLEPAYRFSNFGGPDSILGRLQLAFRMQQFYRLQQGSGDFLPAIDTQRADWGVNYFLPREVKLNASYGRQFTAAGDSNIWDFGITYRFMFPLLPGRAQ